MTNLHLEKVRVIDGVVNCPNLPLIIGDGTAKAIIWPGMGASYRSLNLIELKQHAKTIDFRHESDSAYYIMSGEGVICDAITGEETALVEGSMIHVDRSDTYRFEARGPHGMKAIGGPCPADQSLYAHLHTVKAP